ncbi:Holliday junction resolvase RuvX [bacterium]|nr:MAG: Holliday junction resolvase RuvX [bacterium]
MNVLGIDPGRDKTGVAVVASDGHICFRTIVETGKVNEAIEPLIRQWMITRIALGDSTSSRAARGEIENLIAKRSWENVRIELVDEKNSTLEARTLYFQEYPPRGLRKLLPISSQVPPMPVDDFAAVIVARRLLAKVSRRE